MSFKGLDTGETRCDIEISAGAHGKLKGAAIVAPDGHVKCHRFLQIPFAVPPVGDRRWRPPQPLPDDYSWETVNGREYGSITAQPTYHIKIGDGSVLSTRVADRALSEDSLTVNVWTPAEKPPQEGWPVYVYLHGGWLQIGNPAMTDKNNPADLLDEGGIKIVIIAVSYRLSAFGFLASKEIAAENPDGCAGNFGFLDQRLGIEWAAKNAQHFGGNPLNITVGGPSAGSYSTQFQLCYEFNFPVTPLISRVIQYSNAIPAQPKSVQESQEAFDGLVQACGIPQDCSGEQKMKRLRSVSAEELMDRIMTLKIHTFRAVSDGVFVHHETMDRIRNGHFARQFKTSGKSIIIGEVEAEEYLYSVTNPPEDLSALSTQLKNYYRSVQVDKITKIYNIPIACDTTKEEDMIALRLLYGKIVADGQVYIPSRGLVQTLFEHGVPMDRVLRYRISWRPEGTSRIAPFPGKVTHSDDTWAWWYSKRYGLSEADCEIARTWLQPLGEFFKGNVSRASDMWWGLEGVPETPKTMRALKAATICTIADDRWDRCAMIAREVRV